MATPLLDVQNLQISFAGKSVVHGIDFSIAPGEKLALVGESGSGKTVTALSLLRLAQNAAVSGKAVFTGVDAAEREAAGAPPKAPVDLLSLPEPSLRGIRGRDIAMIFQEPMTALNPLYSVGDQIAEVLQVHKAQTRDEAMRGAIELLAD